MPVSPETAYLALQESQEKLFILCLRNRSRLYGPHERLRRVCIRSVDLQQQVALRTTSVRQEFCPVQINLCTTYAAMLKVSVRGSNPYSIVCSVREGEEMARPIEPVENISLFRKSV